MLFAGIGETDIKYLTGVVVCSSIAAVRIPLVSIDADVHTDRFYCEGARYIDDAVISFGVCKRFSTLCNPRVLGCCGACSGVCLGPIEFDRCQSIAAHIAAHSIIRSIFKAAVQSSTVICFGFIVGDDNQFLLIIDVNYQIAFIACDLISGLRRSCRPVKVCVVIYISIRSFILNGKSISLFNKGRIRSFDFLTVHIKVIDDNLDGSIGYVFKGNNIVFERKLQFFGRCCWLVMLAQNICIARLCGKIILIYFHSHFHGIGGCSGNSYRLGFRNLDFRMIPQYIVDCIGKLARNSIVVESNGIVCCFK